MAFIGKIHKEPYYNSVTIPASYGNAISQQELLTWIQSIIDELVKGHNSQEEVINEFRKVLEHFDVAIDENVKKYIQLLFDSGELGNIVKESMKEYLSNISYSRTNDIVLTRKQRDLYEFRFTPHTNSGQLFKYFEQGCCIYERNGKRAMTSAFNLYANSKELDKNNSVILRTWRDYTDNQVAQDSSQTYTMGHANGMTYNSDDDFLYIVGSMKYDSDGNYKFDPNIYRIKPDFSTYESKSLLKKHSTDIAFYNHQLYVIDDTYTEPNTLATNTQIVYTIDYATGMQHEKCRIHIPISSKIYNFDITNDKIFLVSSPANVILVYDLNTGEFLWSYNIPNFDKTHCYNVEEIEGISVFDDGSLYLMTHGYDGFSSQTQVMISQVFQGNYLNNLTDNDTELRFKNMTAGNVVFCDPKNIQNNPNGSRERPFNTLNETIEYINNHPYLKQTYIFLENNHKLGIFAGSEKNIIIKGTKEPVSGNTSQCYIVGGGWLQGCSHISFMYINFWGTSLQPHQGYSGKNCILGVFNSNIYFYYCVFNLKGSGDYVTVPLTLYLDSFNTMNYDSHTNVGELDTQFKIGYPTNVVIKSDNKPINQA